MKDPKEKVSTAGYIRLKERLSAELDRNPRYQDDILLKKNYLLQAHYLFKDSMQSRLNEKEKDTFQYLHRL